MHISPTTLAIILALTASVGSLAGVIVAGVFNHLNTRLAKQSEERRHRRELIIQAAIASWKQQMDAYAIHQLSFTHIPLEIYILRMIKFSEAFLEDEEFDVSMMGEKIREMRALTNEAAEHMT